ncbi:MAG: malonyl-ACP O-methyltransferase BioC [Rhodocyclaceae bacterium]|nr:malonyl-ACP O-methyltransferase BioC [Rhodocyclaceae bacterium]
MSQAPLPLDRAAIRRRFAAAAKGFDQASVLHREVAGRMGERLQYVRLEPRRILDLGCGTGADLNFLGERYPQALRLACDLALPMLAQARERSAWFKRLLRSGSLPQLLCADAAALPLASGSTSLVWSNLMLHWLDDPLPAFREMQRTLEVGGLLMFSTLGPDTLKELRQALGEAPPRVHRFIDMHDIGDMLMAAGFAEPVMDMEVLTLTYGSSDDLLKDLRATGSVNAARARARGLTGRQGWQNAMAALETKRREGRLPATFEVVYGHAWKARPRTTDDGRAIVRFDPGKRP